MPTTRPQRRQDADACREQLAADGIEYEIRLHRVGELVVAVRLLGTELNTEAALLLGRGGGHHARAEVARDLDRRRADAAGARVDEHRLARLEAHLARDGNPGREKREQERGALRERRALGQREEPLLVHRNLLRIASAGEQGDDASAVRRLAGDLHARRRRQRRCLRIVPLAYEDVEKVHSRGTNMQQGLSPGHVGLGHVANSQLLRPTGLLDHDRLHCGPRTICVQRADASSTPSAS